MSNVWLDRLTSTPEEMAHYQRERAVLEATELICDLMERGGVSRSELATRLNKSRSYVTQLLSGRTNMTLQTLSDVFHALGRSLHITEAPLSGSATPRSGSEGRDSALSRYSAPEDSMTIPFTRSDITGGLSSGAGPKHYAAPTPLVIAS